MMKKLKKFMLCITVFCLLALPLSAMAASMMVSPEKRVYKPMVLTQITVSSKTAEVYVYQDSTLHVKAGGKEIYKKSFQEEGIMKIRLPKQKKNTKLKFYLVNNLSGKKGKTVTVSVREKTTGTAPQAPQVKKTSKNYIQVKGKVGCRVYIRETTGAYKNKWIQKGVITSKEGIKVMLESSDKANACSVRLRDKNGKNSKAVKVQMTGQNILESTSGK